MNPKTLFRRIAAPAPTLTAGATLLIAAAALGLTGCMAETEDPKGLLEGESLAAIKGAKTAVALDGKLYVANRDSAATGIAVVDLATETITAFHAETLPPNELAFAGDSVLVIAESDFKTGALSRLNVKTGRFEASYKSINSDNALSAAGDRVFLMERRLGVVTGFTGGALADANVDLNVNTGTGSNPYETAQHGSTAFITRYGSAFLLTAEADKKDGGKLDSIDLSAFVADSLRGDSDAVPNMDAAIVYGDRLFVTVQRLTAWEAKDTSKIVIIDAKSRKVTGEIALLRKNPIAARAQGKYLFVTCVEGYGTHTGAVERIDLEKAEHAGLVVEEKDLTPPSDLVEFVPVSDSRGYVLYSPDFKNGYIKAVSLP